MKCMCPKCTLKTYNETGKFNIESDKKINMQNEETKKETKIIWDRTRDVIYNGNKLYMNTYGCSSCGTNYHFDQIQHSFCPFCGTKYKYTEDVSV